MTAHRDNGNFIKTAMQTALAMHNLQDEGGSFITKRKFFIFRLFAASRTPAFLPCSLEHSEFDLSVQVKWYPTSSKCQNAT